MKEIREQLRARSYSQSRHRLHRDLLVRLPDALPGFIPPMQCKLVDRLPVGEQWAYELKLDGYRALAIKAAGGVKLISRNRKDLSSAFPEVVTGVRRLGIREGVLDGELVALDAQGKPSFQKLQHARAPGREPRTIIYFAFDLLNLEGKQLLTLPLSERKRLLEDVLGHAPSTVRFLPFLEGEPQKILREVERESLEGIIAKLTESRYEPDKRSGAWSKFKIGLEQECVIGGYTQGQGKRASFGALIVGYYDQGKLRYASKVGTGFSNRQIQQIMDLAAPLKRGDSPFESLPVSEGTRWGQGLTAAERKTAIWLNPALVCRVRFTEWTQDGHLRHPAFEGLREDKEARDVVREKPTV